MHVIGIQLNSHYLPKICLKTLKILLRYSIRIPSPPLKYIKALNFDLKLLCIIPIFRNMPVIENLQILPTDLLEQYKKTVSEEALFIAFNQLEDAQLSTDERSK